MDILVLIAALGGVGVGWRLCAELRRIRETLEGIAFTHTKNSLSNTATVVHIPEGLNT
jgi:hypothetical protein